MRLAFGLLLLSALFGGGCATRLPRVTVTAAPVDVLVFVPHPDDETLIAGGVLYEAVQQRRRIAVVFATNGDLGCERDGHLRQDEAITALAALGVPESSVYFLGYPDGYLARLGSTPLLPIERRGRNGECGKGASTYAHRGAFGRDVHSAFFGKPAPLASASIISDLARLLEVLQPRDIYVSHPLDTHPDHELTYVYLRRAIDHLTRWRPTQISVHRGLVHLGGCWPNAIDDTHECPPIRIAAGEPSPPLPAPWRSYLPNELDPVPERLRLDDLERNPKLRAVAAHRSQTGGRLPLSYLYSFAKRAEPFWSETLGRNADGLYRRLRRGASEGRVIARDTFVKFATGFLQKADQHTPLRCNLQASAVTADGVQFDWLVRGERGYRLHVRPSAGEVVLTHLPGRELRRWTLPPDEDTRSLPRFAVTVAVYPEEGNIAEITVRKNGDVIGVAIDTDPITEGDQLRINEDPTRASVTCEAW